MLSDSMCKPGLVAETQFSATDQERFAFLSCDRNPMHMDPVAARRTQAGAPVVHGIHTLLWALEQLSPRIAPTRWFGRVRAQFLKWIYLGETAELVVVEEGPSEIRAQVSVGDRIATKLTIGLEDHEEPGLAEFEGLVSTEGGPLELSLSDLCGRSGTVPFAASEAQIAAAFPALASKIGARRAGEIAILSRLVGMICPGLHSIFAGLDLDLRSGRRSERVVSFQVDGVDERFRKIKLKVTGSGLSGTVDAFMRTPPVAQMNMANLTGKIASGEFAGAEALIIGGSRGLGELCAKIIAAGGGAVTITYAVGREDAERVAAEIRATGAVCRTLRYDVRGPAEQLCALTAAPTHLYYFATGGIARPKGRLYEDSLFREFGDFYLKGFYELCCGLRARFAATEMKAFYPSTVYVEDRPQGLVEYAMAKAAGEVMCAEMSRFLAGLTVLVRRLPRLPTDQTASIAAVQMASPLDVMLPIIRDVQSRK